MIPSTKKQPFKSLIPDALVIIGIGLIGYGLSLWRLDVALTVVGIILLILGVLMLVNTETEKEQS